MDKITQLAKISLLIQGVVGSTRYTDEQKIELYSNLMGYIALCMDLKPDIKNILAVSKVQDKIIKTLKLKDIFNTNTVDLNELKEMTGLI